jgi:hypothetical protein
MGRKRFFAALKPPLKAAVCRGESDSEHDRETTDQRSFPNLESKPEEIKETVCNLMGRPSLAREGIFRPGYESPTVHRPQPWPWF